jgi:hypothetical protein
LKTSPKRFRGLPDLWLTLTILSTTGTCIRACKGNKQLARLVPSEESVSTLQGFMRKQLAMGSFGACVWDHSCNMYNYDASH